MSAEKLLIRPYDASYGSCDADIAKKIAEQTWPENPIIYSDEGFVIESATSNQQKPAIIGFILYQYCKPSVIKENQPITSYQQSSWLNIDFKKYFNSLNKNDDNNNNNRDKNKNWKLLSHIIHITDFAIIPTFRGQGIGSYLLQTLIYSFPTNTRFGLEVISNNHNAINCYQKCGFITTRKVKDYYGKNKCALKMILISSYNDTQYESASIINNETQFDAKYSVRFSDNDEDMAGIKRILYETWPNDVEYRYTEKPITIVVEETFNDKKCIVGFAQCTWTLLMDCTMCTALNLKPDNKQNPKHTHNGWYNNKDFDFEEKNNRIMPNKNDYKALFKYNLYFNANREKWICLENFIVHIKQFAVDKNHRHKGLGSLLMKHIIYLFPKSTMFGLEVEITNYNAIRLYTKCGFKIQRKIINYYGIHRDGYKMSLISKYTLNESIKYLKENEIVLKPQHIKRNCFDGNGINSKQILKIQQEIKNDNDIDCDTNFNYNYIERSLSKNNTVNDGDDDDDYYLYPADDEWSDNENGNQLILENLNKSLIDDIKYVDGDYNIRKFDTYLDRVYVEALLSDLKSWSYWPYIDTKTGFVVEIKGKIIGFIGYQYVEPLNMMEIMNTNSLSIIGWIDTDFKIYNDNDNDDEENKIDCDGMIIYDESSRSQIVYITQFCVHYNYQHHGIGCKLMSYFIKSFPNKTKFGLEVETTNNSAIGLFIKYGFIKQRIVENFYDFNRNAYKMTMKSNLDKILKKSMNQLKELKNKIIKISNKYNDENNNYKLIKKTLKRLCGDNWNKYFENFVNEQVMDNDIFNLNNDDLRCLINKIGPRSRFRKWIKELIKIKQKQSI